MCRLSCDDLPPALGVGASSLRDHRLNLRAPAPLHTRARPRACCLMGLASTCGHVDVENFPQGGGRLGMVAACTRNGGVGWERQLWGEPGGGGFACAEDFLVTGWCWLLRFLPLGNGGREIDRRG